MKDTRIQQFKINSYEVEESTSARLTSIANYLQEIAYNHANELGVGYHALLKRKMVWVLSRLHIEMERYPVWDEVITVETWPRPFERLFANRDFKISDSSGKRIGRATTQWLVLDSEKHRPVRPFDDLFAFPLRTDPSLDNPIEAVEPQGEMSFSCSRHVRYSDLDVVGHVNNVKYIEWALDALPLSILNEYRISAMTIAYLQEARKDDEVSILVSSILDSTIWVKAVRHSDQKEVVRVQFRLDKR